MMGDVVTCGNTASDPRADMAYRSLANVAWLSRQSRISRIHRKKACGKPVAEGIAKATAAKSKIRARVGHMFTRPEDQWGRGRSSGSVTPRRRRQPSMRRLFRRTARLIRNLQRRAV
jgi:hypothetical protein